MKTSHLLLILALAVLRLDGSPCNAVEPGPSVDSVLAKWEDASQKCKILDAKLTVWRYDHGFGHDHQPTITRGRFYYEAPNLGRYEIRESAKGATNDWSSISEAVIWTGKETLLIEGRTRHCTKFSALKMRSWLSQPEGENEGWLLGIFSHICRQVARGFQEPQQLRALLIGIRGGRAMTANSPITDNHVSRLIVGKDIKSIAVYDVSDQQLYGRKHFRRLSGSLADQAKSAGCEPLVYQSVLWWCLVYMPVLPRGVFFVLPCKECDDPDGDALQYRAIPVRWDWPQVRLHYLVAYLPLLLLACGLGAWWWLH